MMTEDEFDRARTARPLVRYVVMWPENGVIVQTFVDRERAEFLASIDSGVEIVKMVEAVDE